MYSVKFIPENGDPVILGTGNSIVFDLTGASGISVKLGTAQGFDQIGNTVETETVNGQTLSVKGCIFSNVPTVKEMLRKAFSPFQKGRLVFGEYFIYVWVKSSPAFSPVRDDGKFSMQLYAPYPFWRVTNEQVNYIGSVTPRFSFPVNYSTPHTFGEKSKQKYINVYNGGDVSTFFRVDLTASGDCRNVAITNLQTLEFIKLNGTIKAGERVVLEHDPQNQLEVTLIRGGETEDIISWVDDRSNLYALRPGDNIIQATDDGGGTNLTARISFNKAVSAVYEADPIQR